ncbi:hypothetical protein ACVBEQ_02470 [Nakamurella sp. GG22]
MTQTTGEQQLWDALRTARCTCALPTAAEDAVFRFYLPLAHSRAASFAEDESQPDGAALQAAEVGLAKAVLAWRGADCRSFIPFALVAIDAHLRRLARDGGEFGSVGHTGAVPGRAPARAPQQFSHERRNHDAGLVGAPSGPGVAGSVDPARVAGARPGGA